MWFPNNPPDAADPWAQAVEHLRKADRKMSRAIDLVGPCALRPRKDYFVVLCKSVVSQQVSTAAAATIFGRFRDLFPCRRPTPAKVVELMQSDLDRMRRCGFSRQKLAYVCDLAEHFTTNQIPTRRLASMSDEQVIESLTKVNGIGRWTAEMFLIFTLNRPDVWPVDDLGLRNGAKLVLGLKEVPTAKALIPMGELYRPWRSIATWYIWRAIPKLTAPKVAKARVVSDAAK